MAVIWNPNEAGRLSFLHRRLSNNFGPNFARKLQVVCNGLIPAGYELNYVVGNLPSHVVQ
jgi:hypothetical protein